MTFEHDSRGAVRLLPGDLALWMSRALRGGWLSLAAGAYENGGPGGAVCPIAAAAMLAGAWVDGGIGDGHVEWGTAEGPSPEVEDFAAYFDICAEEVGLDQTIAICAEEAGLDQTIAIVSEALAEDAAIRQLAA